MNEEKKKKKKKRFVVFFFFFANTVLPCIKLRGVYENDLCDFFFFFSFIQRETQFALVLFLSIQEYASG